MAFQLISVAAFAAFYGCYFVKMLRQKRRGIQTDQLGKGKAGFAKFVEITMKAAAVLAFAAGLISIFTGTGRSPAAVRAAGAAMSVGGTIVFIFAVRAMGDSWRAGFPKPIRRSL